MPLYKLDGSKLSGIQEVPIQLESDLQKIIEHNLDAAFGLKFVSSEYQLGNLRIDTLAYDEEARAFVIVEYKRDKSFSVIDQGFAYLALLVNRKADFVLEFNEKAGRTITKNDIDWRKSKVIFIANSFTNYQKSAIGFKDLPMELWEARRFHNNTIYFSQLQSPEASESINLLKNDRQIEAVTREVRPYTVDEHFGENWARAREIYEALRDRVLNIDSRLCENPKKQYIAFKMGNSNIGGVHIYRSKVVLWFGRTRPEDLKDPECRSKYRKNCMKYYNQHITDVTIQNLNQIDYAVALFRQVYDKFLKQHR